MAYAALVSLEHIIDQVSLEHVIDQLPPHAQYYVSFPIQDTNEYVHLCPKQQMKSLHENIVFLQQHLEEFPKECLPLESRIRDVAHQLEDIIESYMSGPPYISFGNDDYGKELHSSHMFYAFCSCTQEVHSILEETAKMEKNSEHDVMLWTGNSSTTSSTRGPRSGKDTMVGFEEDLTNILDRAMGHNPALQFIPIVGMGGIGKTTLARNLYEHPSIVCHFDTRSWVTVSQEYRLRDILLGLLSNYKPGTQEDDESLILHLSQCLNGRRFFIVLDDMWHSEVWDKIMRAFSDDNNGSRIIITTRLSEVADEIDSSSAIHRMKFLNEDQSWSLLREKVYEEECCPPQLENIGKTIAGNCKGLPLAIIVISGLLKVNKTQDYWEEIGRNVSEAASTTSNDQLIKILSLSYDNLPHHLKACFLYMGAFQEDFVILSDKLIQLWVAEGFVKSKRHKGMEKVAEEYLEDLLSRCLVLVNPQYDDNEYISIHDMLRELCLRKGQEENFLQHCTREYIDENNCSRIIKGQRRITVHIDNLELLPNGMHNSPLRSILFVGNRTLTSLVPLISKFKLLRKVYELSVRVEDLSSDSIIYKLIHLKYLSIVSVSDNYAHEIHIHASIVKLQNLQTLRLEFNYELVVVLPLNIWRMQKLRHLVLTGDWSIPDLQQNSLSCNLFCLQTLSSIVNFKFTNDAIKRFPNLKGLGVKYSWDIGDCAEFGLNNLGDLQHLDELSFEFYGEGYSWTSIVFPRNLRKLTVSGCILSHEKISDIASLNNLEVLDLFKCPFAGDEWEPLEDECFLRLKLLKMRYLELRIWDAEDTHFPCLEELLISQCSFEIPESIGDIPTLEKLTITFCDEETNESATRIQEKQLSYGNDKLQFLITPF